MGQRVGRWTMALALMTALIGLAAGVITPAAADETAASPYSGYVLAGDCDTIRSQPKAELGELADGDERARELAEEVEPAPETVWGTEATVPMTLDALTGEDHVLAIREARGDVQPVIACGEIGDEESPLELELKAFGDTGMTGAAVLEASGDETTVRVALWEATVAAEPERQMLAMPDFELAMLDGETRQMADYRGKTVLVVMWASWCPYCDAEFPMYEELWQDLQDDDVVVLGVGLKNDDHDDAVAFVERHGATFPVARDTIGGSGPWGEIEATLGVPGTPALFIVTPGGDVYGAQFGVVERQSLEEALADAATYTEPVSED